MSHTPFDLPDYTSMVFVARFSDKVIMFPQTQITVDGETDVVDLDLTPLALVEIIATWAPPDALITFYVEKYDPEADEYVPIKRIGVGYQTSPILVYLQEIPYRYLRVRWVITAGVWNLKITGWVRS